MTDPTSAIKPPRTAIFTIAAGNYLHFVRTLMDRVTVFAPGADRWLGLCDRPEAADWSGENFQVMPLDDLTLPDPKAFVFKYTLLELSTAIKPFIIEALARQGYERIVYFDPDICIYHSLDDLLHVLDQHEIVLTPHITEGYRDDKRPGDREILQCGTYNLGFAAFRWTETTAAFIRWWQAKLTDECVVDFTRGLFVDQKWMEFAPSFVGTTHICRHPGWNVAYWNLPSRSVASSGHRFHVNGEPLVFYHFSGFHPERGTFSNYQDRYSLDTLPDAVKTLASDYTTELKKNGYPATANQRCVLNEFPNGVAIPDGARRLYREQISTLARRFPDPWRTDSAAYIAYLNEPVAVNGRSSPLITRIGYDIYLHGPDVGLARQFPDITGAHAEGFARWLLDAKDLVRLDPIFLAQIQKTTTGDGKTAKPVTTGGTAKWLYQQAWKFKHLTHWLLPLTARQKIHGWMFNRAYVKATPPTSSSEGRNSVKGQPMGINLVGYLQAELGVGEAARATHRAAQAAGIPVSLIDFRKGVTSRMGEDIDQSSATQPTHPVNILHINADQLPYAVADHHEQMQGRYNIGVWNWELPEFPDEWMESFQFLDELWAPSAFCQRAFSAKSPIPVCHMPYAITIDVPPHVGRKELGLPESPFIFLFMFDVLSVPERKNPSGLLKAYRKAKSRFNRDVILVVKMINTKTAHPLLDEMRAAAAADPSIILIERYLDRPDLNALFNTADCYVSLHRSEGFGLTLAESMYLGKPVIGTGWSSTTDFMDSWNSFLVNYTLVQLDRDYGPYKKGQWWAEPNIDDAAANMVHVVNDPIEAQKRAIKGQNLIRSTYRPDIIGRRIRDRLLSIGLTA